MIRKVLYGLAIVTVLFGLWGVYDRFASGHESADYGSYMMWGLWVAMYLFFTGAAVGAFIFATLDYLFNVRIFARTGRLSLLAALAALAAGLLTVWFDLGRMERIWRVYLEADFESVMAQIVWGYTLFGVLLVVMIVMSLQRERYANWLKGLSAAGLPLALFLSGGVGALLGVESSRPFWHVGLFPVQFPVFSLASGAAMLLLIHGLFDRTTENRAELLRSLAILTIILQGVKLFFLWADLSQSMYGGVEMNVDAVEEMLFGQYWWAFWLLQIGLGTIVPILILAPPRLAQQPIWAASAGALVLLGFVVARANIVFPAQSVSTLEGLADAFQEVRLDLSYFPSGPEWALAIGMSGLAGLIFLLAYDGLALLGAEEKA
jgi:molybdopterin-containing oxidoreductase family membrane subunit